MSFLNTCNLTEYWHGSETGVDITKRSWRHEPQIVTSGLRRDSVESLIYFIR